jgi:predicted Zn-dependent protease
MRATDALLALSVGALGGFVGIQVARRPAAPASVTARPAAPPASATPTPNSDVIRLPAPAARASDAPHLPPAASVKEVRDRIDAAPGTYMSQMLGNMKGAVVRWPERPERGLRIWVQSMSAVREWDLRYAQMARDAFADWGDAGLPMRLDFVLDSATSDVTIVWIDHFAAELGSRIGVTTRSNDRDGWLVSAQIAIAVHDSSGRPLQPVDLAGIVRHEAGHALGLGHSTDPHDKMYPVEMSNQISAADRATLRLLYQLPAGSVR